MTEELQKVATDKLIEVFDTVTKTVAPAALELAEGAMKISGIQSLLIGVAFSIVAIAIHKGISVYLKNNDGDWDHPIPIFGAIASAIFYILCLFQLLNVWNWIAIFTPKLAIVNKILKF